MTPRPEEDLIHKESDVHEAGPRHEAIYKQFFLYSSASWHTVMYQRSAKQ
jgi:hypothetical protein